MGTFQTAFKTLFASALVVALSGCTFEGDLPTPVPASGGDPGTIANEHDVILGWKFPELQQLQSLKVLFPAQVTIVQTQDSEELQVQIQALIEKDHDSDYGQELQSQVIHLSNLSAANAVLNVPTPSHPCVKSVDAQGGLTSLQGVCLESLTILVPASVQIPMTIQPGGSFSLSAVTLPTLDLTLVDGAQAAISQLTGSLNVFGGGPHTSLQVNGATNLYLDLSQIEQAQLASISKSVFISLSQPDTSNPNAVTLDGKAITSFPFMR
jgi:hypothetical protein